MNVAKRWIKSVPFIYSQSKRVRSFAYRIRARRRLIRDIKTALKQKEKVFFVQVGSNDGSHGDPLRSLIFKHSSWRGLFIEPVPFLFERLKQNYNNSPRFYFEQVAIGTEAGRKTFYYVSQAAESHLKGLPYCYDQLGSFDRNHIVKHFDGILEPFIVEEELTCLPLKDVLDRNGVDQIDLLHIDTEGFDYRVLAQVDFRRYSPEVVLYEHVHLSANERVEAELLLKSLGYSMVSYNELDTLAVRKSV